MASKGTEVYGASDDLVEFDGEYSGEVGAYDTSEDEPIAVFLSDGTVLAIHYGESGVWKIDVQQKGSLFDALRVETDPEAGRYSDTAVFAPGIRWAYAIRARDGLKVVS